MYARSIIYGFCSPMKPLSTTDPYSVLGLDRKATQAQIKAAYFKQVRTYSPEREPDMFKKIRAAYEQLQTPERRAQTDLFLLQPPPELANRRQPTFDLTVHPEDLITLALEWYVAERAPQEEVDAPEILNRL